MGIINFPDNTGASFGLHVPGPTPRIAGRATQKCDHPSLLNGVDPGCTCLRWSNVAMSAVNDHIQRDNPNDAARMLRSKTLKIPLHITPSPSSSRRGMEQNAVFAHRPRDGFLHRGLCLMHQSAGSKFPVLNSRSTLSTPGCRSTEERPGCGKTKFMK